MWFIKKMVTDKDTKVPTQKSRSSEYAKRKCYMGYPIPLVHTYFIACICLVEDYRLPFYQSFLVFHTCQNEQINSLCFTKFRETSCYEPLAECLMHVAQDFLEMCVLHFCNSLPGNKV